MSSLTDNVYTSIGSFKAGVTRKRVKNLVLEHGGTWAEKVNSKVTHVVVESVDTLQGNAHLAKAQQQGACIVSRTELWSKVGAPQAGTL